MFERASNLPVPACGRQGRQVIPCAAPSGCGTLANFRYWLSENDYRLALFSTDICFDA